MDGFVSKSNRLVGRRAVQRFELRDEMEERCQDNIGKSRHLLKYFSRSQ